MRVIACLAVGAMLAACLVTPLAAEDSRYSTWGDGASYGGGEDLDALFERLNDLIDDAERSRAADPRFLDDLRAAIDDYTRTARHSAPSELLHDDFRDGDYTRDPFWKVTRGKFTVDSRLGLRSVVTSGRRSSSGGSDDLANELLGALLGKKNDDGGSRSPAEIYLAKPFSNAFALRLDIVSQQGVGRFVVDIYQGNTRGAGYRLAYYPGSTPSLELLRYGSRGEAVIASLRERLVLEDGYRHRIELERSADREMIVKVDGRTVIRAADYSFRDPFDGIAFINEGGDYAIREVSVTGVY